MGLQRHYRLGLFSDVTINMEFKAHKLILSSQSGYFYNFFSKPKNNTTNVVTHIYGNSQAVQSMISFKYGVRYKPDVNHDPAAAALVHIDTYALAEEYQVDGLKELAKFKFDTLVFSLRRFDGSFVRVITEVYESANASVLTDREFQKTVAEVAYENLDELRDLPDFCGASTRFPKFRADLGQYGASGPREFRYICQYCSRLWVSERAMKDNRTDRCDCPKYRKSLM
ncbi:hypothetical protein FQN52_003055 [Onygenales sp. PD_12]|nr:hypothetical protein FQN52_003055 [Onygenales sp. PD_12]